MTEEAFTQMLSLLLERFDKLTSELERVVDALERLVQVAEEESEEGA